MSHSPQSPAETPTLPHRLLSLDVYRGLIMCTLAAGGLGLAATARKLGYEPDTVATTWEAQIWQWLAFHNSHPDWNSQFYWVGCSYWDLIQPSFMFMVGVSMPFSYASRRARGHSPGKLTAHALVRALVLVAIGVFLSTHRSGLLANNHLLTNVLAQIGLGYFFVFLLLGQRAGIQIVVAIAVLVGYGAWMMHHPVPDPTPPAAAQSIEDLSVPREVAVQFALNTNAAADFDVKLFNLLPQDKPVKAHPAGYATLNFIPSAVTMLLGVLAGRLLRSDRSNRSIVLILVLSGGFSMITAVVLSFTCCPVVKKIWTPAWTLYSGAWTFWILASLYWVIDVRGWKAWTFPLAIVGMNSLAMYLMGMLLKGWVGRTLEVYFGDQIFAGPYGPTVRAMAVFSIFWLVCLYLYRSRIFFRV